jgi:Leucine-rich repeat (LRR) protein
LAKLGRELSELDVQYCVSTTTPLTLNASIFETNSMLREIRINKCSVATIAPRTFKAMWLLRLDLAWNEISSISNETFEGLNDLMALYLESNAITSIAKETFMGHRILAGLNLGLNKISFIEAGSFLGLGKLEQLTLEGNRIGTLRSEMFDGLSNLKELFLGNNMYLVLQDDSFTEATSLEHIDLSQNEDLLSRSLSARFLYGLRNLTWIDLTGVDLTQAKILDNDLSVYFKDQRDSLTKLTLTNSNFNNDLFPMILGLRELNTLELDDNNIGYLLSSSLPKLEKEGSISLKGNGIMYVEEGSFSGMQGLVVYMDDNPFYCSCSLMWFGGFLRSTEGSVISNRHKLLCGGPIDLYRTRVKAYNPYWWTCSRYVPYIALAFVIGFCLLLLLILLIIWCNWVNLRHWLLERRELARINEEDERKAANNPEQRPLGKGRIVTGYNTLPKGKTGAFICYDMYDQAVLRWVNQYIEGKLYNHPLRITVQWSAGNDFIPIWKQVKDYGFGVQSFLVVATTEFITKYWPEISEKSGYENISKFVLVLMGVKPKDLPKDLRRLRCPTLEWPETRTCCTTLGRRRTQFWKQLRLFLKGIPDTQ